MSPLTASRWPCQHRPPGAAASPHRPAEPGLCSPATSEQLRVSNREQSGKPILKISLPILKKELENTSANLIAKTRKRDLYLLWSKTPLQASSGSCGRLRAARIRYGTTLSCGIW